MMPRILAFASSTRRESFNKKLVTIAAQGAREAGAEVTLIDLKDFPLPLFDQDLEAEQGMPENGKHLKKLFIDHDGLLIASPEYNSSLPAVLKNVIDWVSRPAPGELPWAVCEAWSTSARSSATLASSCCRTRSPWPRHTRRSSRTAHLWTPNGRRASKDSAKRWHRS